MEGLFSTGPTQSSFKYDLEENGKILLTLGQLGGGGDFSRVKNILFYSFKSLTANGLMCF